MLKDLDLEGKDVVMHVVVVKALAPCEGVMLAETARVVAHG